VLTFTAPTPDTALVINRDGADRVTKSAIVAGQAWNFTLANDTDVKATPYMGYSNSYAGVRGLGHDRGIGWVSGSSAQTLTWLIGRETRASCPRRSAEHDGPCLREARANEAVVRFSGR
jgi:hypothetical protein